MTRDRIKFENKRVGGANRKGSKNVLTLLAKWLVCAEMRALSTTKISEHEDLRKFLRVWRQKLCFGYAQRNFASRRCRK